MHRPNLDILTGAHVTRIHWDGITAAGVSFERGGRLQKVLVKKEILLSAGSVGSPQLLMLSGVGPREQLEQLRVPVVADLPVGENLQDHLHLFGPEWTIQEPVSMKYLPDSYFWSKMSYFLLGTGDAASAHVIAEGFVTTRDRSHDNPDGLDQPLQIQLFGNLIGGNIDLFHDFQAIINYKPEIHQTVYGGMIGKEGFCVMLIQTHPRSSGYIHLKSGDPFEYPEIEPNYFSDPLDVEALIRGIRIAQKLFATKEFKKLGAKQHHVVHPDCKRHEYDSDPYWECYYRVCWLPTAPHVVWCRS